MTLNRPKQPSFIYRAVEMDINGSEVVHFEIVANMMAMEGGVFVPYIFDIDGTPVIHPKVIGFTIRPGWVVRKEEITNECN